MEYVLVDIKNFLKKLESGQLEIEAAQWELHKALSNMTKGVSELKILREDVEDLKTNNIQQMGLIKQLQEQLARLNGKQEDLPMTISSSSVEYKRVFKRPNDAALAQKGFKKRKCHIRSEEIIEITSQVSNDKSEAEEHQSDPTAEETSAENDTADETQDVCMTDANENSDEGSSQKNVKKESYTRQQPEALTPRCSGADNDMLQRYLTDSVKYVDRKTSNATDLNRESSNQSECERSHSQETTPFWDHYSSRAPPERHSEKRKASREASVASEAPVENKVSRKITCSSCPKRLSQKLDTSKHEKSHGTKESVCHCKSCGKSFSSKDQLKNHETIHKISSRFKGFRCSYCTKSCRSPEKLTAHLRKCRLIMKPSAKKTCS